MPLRVGSSSVARIVMAVEPFESVLVDEQFAYANQALETASPLWVQFTSTSSDTWGITSQMLDNGDAEDSDIYYYARVLSGRFAVEVVIDSGISTLETEGVGLGGFLNITTRQSLAFWITQTTWSIRVGQAGQDASTGFQDPSAVIASGTHAFGTSGTLRMEHNEGVLTFSWNGSPITAYSGALPDGSYAFPVLSNNHVARIDSFLISEYISTKEIIAVHVGSEKVWPVGPAVVYETDWSEYAAGYSLATAGDGWDGRPDGWEEINVVSDGGTLRAQGNGANTMRGRVSRISEIPARESCIVEATFTAVGGSDYAGITYHGLRYFYGDTDSVQHYFRVSSTTLEWGTTHGNTTGTSAAGSAPLPGGVTLPYTMRAQATALNSVDLYINDIYVATHDTSGVPSVAHAGVIIADLTITCSRFAIYE